MRPGLRARASVAGLAAALLFGGLAAPPASAQNQSPSLVLSETSLEVPEAGSANYTVQLATQPSADVTVSIGGTSGTDLTLNRTSLTFTTTNTGRRGNRRG